MPTISGPGPSGPAFGLDRHAWEAGHRGDALPGEDVGNTRIKE